MPPYRIVIIYQRCGGAYFFHLQYREL